MTFYALCAVVGSVVYRSVEAVQAPDYDWSHVHAFRPPIDALDALPILAFGFQASRDPGRLGQAHPNALLLAWSCSMAC